MKRLVLAGLFGLVSLAGCKAQSGGPEGTPDDATASPQATAIPAPLATPAVNASAGVVVTPEGGPPPVPLRGDVALGPDTLARIVGRRYSSTRTLCPLWIVCPFASNRSV